MRAQRTRYLGSHRDPFRKKKRWTPQYTPIAPDLAQSLRNGDGIRTQDSAEGVTSRASTPCATITSHSLPWQTPVACLHHAARLL